MQFTLITLTTLAAAAFASPQNLALVQNRQSSVCSTLYNNPLCCDVDVLGVADLNCEVPPTTPANITDFTAICAGIGKIDSCCILPILEQGLLCTAPDGS